MNAEVTLAFIKEYLTNELVFQEESLKLNYGKKWREFIQHRAGIGYKISRDLLNKIEEFEKASEELPIHPVNGLADHIMTHSSIANYCETQCPTQVCGRCFLKCYSPIIKQKGDENDD